MLRHRWSTGVRSGGGEYSAGLPISCGTSLSARTCRLISNAQQLLASALHTILFLGATATLLSLLGGCRTEICRCRPVTTTAGPESDADQNPSSSLSAQVFIDSSGSMRGFVAANPRTQYVRFLQTLELTFVTGWSNSAVVCYQFGKTPRRVTRRPCYEAASKPRFYIDQETRIDHAFETVTPNTLTIVITDLFQSDSDVGALIRVLRDQAIRRGMSIGIIGARSEFDGTVSEVGAENRHFRYRSTPGREETYRPFYAVIAGRRPDVQRYLEQFRLGYPQSAAGCHAIVLSPQKGVHVLDVQSFKLSDVRGAVRMLTFLAGCSNDKAFALRDRSIALSMVARGTYKSSGDAPAPDIGKATTIVEASKCSGDQVERSSVADQALEATLERSGDGQAALRLSVEPRKLPGAGIYVFRLRWVAGPDAYTLPDWCDQWEMDLSRLPQWEAHPGTFDGSKTQNIREFVSGLWTSLVRDTAPELGSFELYVKS